MGLQATKMGRLLYHPQAPEYAYPFAYRQQNDSSQLLEESPISGDIHTITRTATDRVELRDYMLTHSLRGNKLSKTRTPFVGELTPLTSPEDKDVIFQLKRFGNREILSYRDKNSQVRYIYEEDDQKMITEKDYPVGSMQIDVVELGLSGWNITHSDDKPVPLTRENIIGYLMPEELDAVYTKIMEINPSLSGEKARKNS
jgi:hypothetical protein